MIIKGISKYLEEARAIQRLVLFCVGFFFLSLITRPAEAQLFQASIDGMDQKQAAMLAAANDMQAALAAMGTSFIAWPDPSDPTHNPPIVSEFSGALLSQLLTALGTAADYDARLQAIEDRLVNICSATNVGSASMALGEDFSEILADYNEFAENMAPNISHGSSGPATRTSYSLAYLITEIYADANGFIADIHSHHISEDASYYRVYVSAFSLSPSFTHNIPKTAMNDFSVAVEALMTAKNSFSTILADLDTAFHDELSAQYAACLTPGIIDDSGVADTPGGDGFGGGAADADGDGVPDWESDHLGGDGGEDHYNAMIAYLDANWLPVIPLMIHDFAVSVMTQMGAIGMLFDAKHQLETQRLFNIKTLEAHHDYQPDLQMCRMGTNIRSLAASEEIADHHVRLIDRVLTVREHGEKNSVAGGGTADDIADRLERFKTTYCDVDDNNGELVDMCTGSAPADRINKDIDYARTLGDAYTLDLDLLETSATMSADEQDMVALARNLFAHQLPERFLETFITKAEAKDDIMDVRSLQAVRSVARNSYAHLAAMKAEGSGDVDDFMEHLIRNLGVSSTDEIETLVGENPSYYAQMEVLTKKIYQDPAFYTNLYTSTENVKRIGAALNAIQLMQDRDRFEASLRREVLISLILEMNLRDEQDYVDGEIFRDLARDIGSQ